MAYRIAVASDSHGDRDAVEAFKTKIIGFDRIFFLGDGARAFLEAVEPLGIPITAVAGNCDFFPGLPHEAVDEACGVRFFLTHGNRYRVDCGLQALSYRAAEESCAFALFGHTHVVTQSEWGGVTLLNPGSLSRPRQGKRSFGVLEFDGRKFLTKIELI